MYEGISCTIRCSFTDFEPLCSSMSEFYEHEGMQADEADEGRMRGCYMLVVQCVSYPLLMFNSPPSPT